MMAAHGRSGARWKGDMLTGGPARRISSTCREANIALPPCLAWLRTLWLYVLPADESGQQQAAPAVLQPCLTVLWLLPRHSTTHPTHPAQLQTDNQCMTQPAQHQLQLSCRPKLASKERCSGSQVGSQGEKINWPHLAQSQKAQYNHAPCCMCTVQDVT